MEACAVLFVVHPAPKINHYSEVSPLNILNNPQTKLSTVLTGTVSCFGRKQLQKETCPRQSLSILQRNWDTGFWKENFPLHFLNIIFGALSNKNKKSIHLCWGDSRNLRMGISKPGQIKLVWHDSNRGKWQFSSFFSGLAFEVDFSMKIEWLLRQWHKGTNPLSKCLDVCFARHYLSLKSTKIVTWRLAESRQRSYSLNIPALLRGSPILHSQFSCRGWQWRHSPWILSFLPADSFVICSIGISTHCAWQNQARVRPTNVLQGCKLAPISLTTSLQASHERAHSVQV